MRVLLDTHVFLWAVMDSKRLSTRMRTALRNATEVYVSAASIWEIAIKHSLGKINVAATELADAVEASGFRALPITLQHAAAVEKLPDHHRDPFDRLLIAQALCEPLRLLSADAMLARYSELVMLI